MEPAVFSNFPCVRQYRAKTGGRGKLMKAVPVHQPLEDREGAFRVRRAVDNLNRLQLICIVYIGVVLWFAAVNGAAVAAGSRVLVGIEYYSVLYTAFFAFNVYTLLRVKRLRRRATVAVENVH